MKVLDLGDLDGPVTVYGGVYSNLAAWQSFRAGPGHADGLAAINLGDAVGYCAQGARVVAELRESGHPVLKGNCEENLAAGAADCGCGYGAGSECSILARGWYAHAQATTDAGARAWMGDLPDRIVFRHRGARWACLHGGAGDIATFLWPVTPDATLAREIALLETQVGPVDGVFGGHSGVPMVREVGRWTWVNPGALGMPPHDGAPQTRFAVLDGVPRIARLSYDPAPEMAAMVRAGLTQGYDRALESGYWPSEDTLPPALRHESTVT